MTFKELLLADLNRFRSLQGLPAINKGFASTLLKFLSPRLMPILLYRLSFSSYRCNLKIFAKLFSLLNFVIFGIEISPQIHIGPGLFFPHTQGTVIGARKIGANAIIFQQVTLGAKEVDMGFNAELRPEIGDNVTLGAGSKILGNIVINNDCTIGANSVVISSIPAGSVAVGSPARVINRQS
ncbi:MAG: serine O-acetyltransferase [Bacteroidia bacterium]